MKNRQCYAQNNQPNEKKDNTMVKTDIVMVESTIHFKNSQYNGQMKKTIPLVYAPIKWKTHNAIVKNTSINQYYQNHQPNLKIKYNAYVMRIFTGQMINI